MADLGMLQRRGFFWLLALLGILFAAAVLWFLSSLMEGRAADLEMDPGAPGAAGEVTVLDRGGIAAPAAVFS